MIFLHFLITAVFIAEAVLGASISATYEVCNGTIGSVFATDGQFLYINTGIANVVTFAEISTGAKTSVALTGTSDIRDFAYDADYIYVGRNAPEAVAKLSKATKEVVGYLNSYMPVSVTVVGTTLYCCSNLNADIWDITSGLRLKQFNAFSNVGYGLVPDGNLLYAASQDGFIRAYSVSADYAFDGVFPQTSSNLFILEVTADYVLGSADNAVFQFWKNNRTLFRTFPASITGSHIVVRGGFLFMSSATVNGQVDEFDLDSGVLRNTYVRSGNSESVSRFDINGISLYVLYNTGYVRCFKIPDPPTSSLSPIDSPATKVTPKKSSSVDSPASKVTAKKTSSAVSKSRPAALPKIAVLARFQNLKLSMVIAILVGLFFVAIIMLILCYTFVYRRRSVQTKTTSNATATSTMVSSTYASSNSSTTYTQNNSTMFNTNFGLSTPSFLELKFGESFRLRHLIAKGGGGALHVADSLSNDLKSNGNQVVVKVCHIDNTITMDSFFQEISIMHLLNHPNIVKLLGYTVSPPTIVMKLYSCGDLYNFMLDKNSRKTKCILSHFMHGIASGISIIHLRGMVHCDLKPQNILIDQVGINLTCVISDFGITNVVSRDSLLVSAFIFTNLKGMSLAYAAPEAFLRVLRGQQIPVKYSWDIYSFGIIMLELIARKGAYK